MQKTALASKEPNPALCMTAKISLLTTAMR